MGGNLINSNNDVPNFIVWAKKASNGANLQRVQIIKGWVDKWSSEPSEKVYDVICSDGLQVDPTTNRCPDNGAKVNISDCSITDNVGSEELKISWFDPEFDPEVKAFYYVRVLENPTCRWSTWDAIRAGSSPRPELNQLSKKELGLLLFGIFHQSKVRKKRLLIFFGVLLGCIVLFFGINLSNKDTIYISDSEVINLLNIWENQTGRAPNTNEIKMIVESLIEEEILYQNL